MQAVIRLYSYMHATYASGPSTASTGLSLGPA
jgi:hypothetical protein